jgi:ribonucleotide reductase alpha subunit
MDDLEILKQNGEAPKWMDEFGLKTLSSGYLLPGETPRVMYRRVAKAAASYYPKSSKLEERFFDIMWKNWLCPASPVLSNMGTNRGFAISCNSIHSADSLDSIFMKNYELAILSKNGAGVGIYLGDVRGRGVPIKGNGASEGIIPWAKIFDQTTLSVSQGCYDDQTELLTEKGWLKFSDLTPGIKVAQSTTNGEISFVDFTDYIAYSVSEDLIRFKNKTSLDLLITKNHRIAVEFTDNTKKLENHLRIIEADKLKLHRDNRFWCASRAVAGRLEALTALDRFYIAYQAEGSIDEGAYAFHFDEERKIVRLQEILDELGWRFTERAEKKSEKDSTTTFAVHIPASISISKKFQDIYDIKDFSLSFAREFIEEIGHWDGSFRKPETIEASSIEYSSIIEENTDFVQAVSFLAGKMSSRGSPVRNKEHHNWKYPIYICDRQSVGGEEVSSTLEYYEGKVFCITVPTGLLVVRRNGIPVICGNSTRRGASALYLPIEHSDIDEFINIRRPVGDINRRCLNINHGVCITNRWMQSMLDGDRAKRQTWEKLLLARVETGEPYFFFSDNVNNNNPECYVKNNLTVKTSNICCLSGDTLVLTKSGAQRIDSLTNKSVSIWDGNQWVLSNSFRQRGEDFLTRVHIKDGSFIDANPKHRWFVANSQEEIRSKQYSLKLTNQLAEGDFIESHNQAPNKRSANWQRIEKIEQLPGIHPVYCPTVPSTGKFALANGLMTGNSEITLYTDPDHSFVCCLSSLNLVRWDEWKDTDTVQLTVRFLDAVLSEYIEKTEGMRGMEASRLSAIKGRAIGIGVLGWHTLLQERSLSFDSFDTMQLNAEIFRTICSKADEETKVLAKELGEPEWCKGFGIRNTHRLALAPTVSNSTISGGHSAGIEPISANVFVQKSAKGTFIRRNMTLDRLLTAKEKNTVEIWKSINEQSGSVQHLSFLSDQEKEVFLTAREINQHTVVKLAVQRQKWIDQAQSVNLFFASNASPKYIHEVHLNAWKSGLKTLYYLRSDGVLKSDLASRSESECKACEA